MDNPTLADFAKNHFNQVAFLHASFFKKSLFAGFVPEVRIARTKEVLSEFLWAFTFTAFDLPIESNPLTEPLKDQFFKDCLLRYEGAFLTDHPNTSETALSLASAFTDFIVIIQSVFNEPSDKTKKYVLGRANESLKNPQVQKKGVLDPIYRLCLILSDGANAIISNDKLTLDMFEPSYRQPATDDVEKDNDKRAFYNTVILDVFYQKLLLQVFHPISAITLAA